MVVIKKPVLVTELNYFLFSPIEVASEPYSKKSEP